MQKRKLISFLGQGQILETEGHQSMKGQGQTAEVGQGHEIEHLVVRQSDVVKDLPVTLIEEG